jgi:hypothetical protein
MTLSGGKRKANKSLKAWVAFVKKVQKEEKLSYKDAIHRAKQRKDKGEKWMSGGATSTSSDEILTEEFVDVPVEEGVYGGRRRRRRTARRTRRRGRGRARTARRGRSQAQAQALSLSQY